MWVRLVLLVAFGVVAGAVPSTSAAQDVSPSALVVSIPGDARYHQPGCPLVAKAGSHVKVMKLAEAERRGLKAHDCQTAAENGGKPTAAESNASAVFVQPGDNKYHKAGCPKLKPTATKTTLDEAGKKYWPCPVCKPGIRQNAKRQ
jgi:hypothetical protein